MSILGANYQQMERAKIIAGVIMNDEQLDAFSEFIERCQLRRAMNKASKDESERC